MVEGWQQRRPEAIEIQNARHRGGLLDAEAVENKWKSILLMVRAGVLRLPRRAGSALGLTPDQTRGLDDECRAVLNEIAAPMTEIGRQK